MAAIGIPYNEEKEYWLALFRTLSNRKTIYGMTDLTLGERKRVLDHLIRKGMKIRNPFVPAVLAGWRRGNQDRSAMVGKGRRDYPGKPKNVPLDRKAQIGKIEALLTVGGKEWNYAHSLAKRICKSDRIEWVPDGQLYKIITALRKQAQREGWDLSGES